MASYRQEENEKGAKAPASGAADADGMPGGWIHLLTIISNDESALRRWWKVGGERMCVGRTGNINISTFINRCYVRIKRCGSYHGMYQKHYVSFAAACLAKEDVDEFISWQIASLTFLHKQQYFV